MEETMRVALCQLDIAWEDKRMNLEQAKVYMEEAKAEEAEIVFFPEMSFTGFSMNVDLIKEEYGETLKEVREMAAESQIAIGMGWVKAEEMGGRMEVKNIYTVIGSQGEILSNYVKIHPFRYAKEDQYFTSGNRISLFEYRERVFSTFLCYDLRFPEIFEIASRKAEIIVVSANWPQPRKEHWSTLLRARAIENQVYILGVNCIGEKAGLYYSGDSCVIDPNGNVMGVLSDQDGLIVLDIPNNTEQIREEFPVKQDRRPELYYKLSEELAGNYDQKDERKNRKEG